MFAGLNTFKFLINLVLFFGGFELVFNQDFHMARYECVIKKLCVICPSRLLPLHAHPG